MALKFLKNPYFLGGTGAIALFGATVYQYATASSQKTGFHHKDSDPTLRIVEKDVLIPKYMTDSARKEKCKSEVMVFNDCVRKTEPNSWARFMTWRTCKPQSDAMMECMNSYFIDENFYEENKARYLQDKAIFQECHVTKKDRILVKEIVLSKLEPEVGIKGEAVDYYNNLKQRFEKTGDIDSYDKELLAKHEAEGSSQKKQLAGFGV